MVKRRQRRGVRCAALAAMLAGGLGCSLEPVALDGKRCDGRSECLPGYRCDEGSCVFELGTLADGAMPDAEAPSGDGDGDGDGDGGGGVLGTGGSVGAPDAGGPDAGPPELRCVALSTDPALVDAPLTDFPLLVRLRDARLSAAREDGADLHFTDADSAPLAFEIEAWDAATGGLVAWVRIPMLSDTAATVLRLCFGDGVVRTDDNQPRAVWDAGFVSVHHFTGGLADATASGIDGTNAGSTDTEGHIAGARAFDGGTHVDMGTGVLPADDTMTVSAWVRTPADALADHRYVMDSSQGVPPYLGMALGVAGLTGGVEAYIDGAFREATLARVPEETWTLVTVRYVIGMAGSFEASVDGMPFETVFEGNTTSSRNSPESPFQVGRWAGDDFYFDGAVDELRVTSGTRPQAWMGASYESQRADSSFLRVED